MFKDSAITFSSYLENANISDDLREKCQKSEILMLPSGLKGNTYPEITGDLFQFIKQELPVNVRIELPVEEKDYKETRFYEPIEIIAAFLVKDIALPILLSIISRYLIKRIKKKRQKNKIKFEFIVEEKEGVRTKKVTYEGDNEGFKNFMDNIRPISKKE